MLAAYFDLKKVSDSVDREALWDLMGLCGIPARIILVRSLAYSPESAVEGEGGISNFFLVSKGVRQRCILASSIFKTCVVWALSSCGLKPLWSIYLEYQGH